MNRFKPFLFVFFAISFVFVSVVTFSLWADYWNACGAKGRACATQEASAAGATEGVSVAGATQGGAIQCAPKGTTAACATHGSSASCATKCQVAGGQGGGAACAATCALAAKQAGTTACPMQGVSAAGVMQGELGSAAGKGSQVATGFLKPYFEMRSLLANDKAKGLDKLSKNLVNETVKLRKTLAKANAPSEQLDALKNIENAASAMKTNSLKSAREGFKGLSHSILTYVQSYGCEGVAYSFYCDMVKESWLQETNKIGNPYYGSQMRKCGVMTGHTASGKYVAD